jgi:hypothetical protein
MSGLTWNSTRPVLYLLIFRRLEQDMTCPALGGTLSHYAPGRRHE